MPCFSKAGSLTAGWMVSCSRKVMGNLDNYSNPEIRQHKVTKEFALSMGYSSKSRNFSIYNEKSE